MTELESKPVECDHCGYDANPEIEYPCPICQRCYDRIIEDMAKRYAVDVEPIEELNGKAGT